MADREERGNLLGEAWRFARTSGAVGGIAARVLGERIGIKTNRAGHAEDLKTILGGLIVKIGARLYDTSLKSRLQRLQYAMKGAA